MQIEPAHLDSTSYLTVRQRQVIACVAQGMSNTDIAAELFISLSTVERELRRARRTLRAANRAEWFTQVDKPLEVHDIIGDIISA